MSSGINESEEYVYDVCKKSFLSLWSYANPQAKKGKELCDILVLCGNDIVIVSVKDIKPSDSGDPETDWERWRKRAIEGSAKQIYGAERWLQNKVAIIEHDGSVGLSLPPREKQNVHRVAIAFGGAGRMSLYYGDFGKGFIHVLDEQAFALLLSELDTISDFLSYLRTKENFFSKGKQIIFEGQEEDLLALYLKFNRSFPEEPDLLVIGDDLWKSLNDFTEYQAKKQEDRISYLWDAIIEEYIQAIMHRHTVANPEILKLEPALREMALEDRYWRRVLSKALVEFLELANNQKIRSRIALSMERKVAYVFLPASPEEDPQYRLAELSARCWIARDKVQDQGVHTVIGIAVGEIRSGYPLDLLYIYKPEWTKEDKTKAVKARQEFGYFLNPIEIRVSADEYPQS